MAPAINTNTCCHVGLVKPCRNGSIQAASLGRPTPAIRPPNPIGERLDRIESAANPWCDHKGFNSDAPSENGQRYHAAGWILGHARALLNPEGSWSMCGVEQTGTAQSDQAVFVSMELSKTSWLLAAQ